MFDWSLALAATALLGGLVVSITTLVLWLSSQFSSLKDLIAVKTEQLKDMFIEKLEYHERHDDKRFEAVTNDLWAIKVRNAKRDESPIFSNNNINEKENSNTF